MTYNLVEDRLSDILYTCVIREYYDYLFRLRVIPPLGIALALLQFGVVVGDGVSILDNADRCVELRSEQLGSLFYCFSSDSGSVA